MKITDSKKAYRTPMSKVVEVTVKGVLCQSGPNGQNTEKFTVSGYSYEESDWE